MKNYFVSFTFGLVVFMATPAHAELVFDVLEIGPASHPYQQRLTFELSGTIDGPLPTVNRDLLYIVSTTSGDTDWLIGSGSIAFGGLKFGPVPQKVVTGSGYNANSVADFILIDFHLPLSVGDSVISTGPYTMRFTFTAIVSGNVDGLALYWGKSSTSGSASSGTFLASDSNLNGPNVVPEPSSFVIFAFGAVSFLGYRKKRRPA